MNTQSDIFTNKRIGETRRFSAPLGDLKRGRLEIRDGISNLDLTGNSSSQDLFQAEFIGLIPNVRAQNERVIISYDLSVVDWLKHALHGHQHGGKVTLNTSIPWQIDIRGGVSHFDADMRELQLSSLAIKGGVADTDVLLPRPSGTVQIYIASGVSNLQILRPKGVSAQLEVVGGASNLIFDDHFYSSIGGGIHITAPNYQAETNRYDIVVSRGVSNLTIRTQS